MVTDVSTLFVLFELILGCPLLEQIHLVQFVMKCGTN